MKQKTNNDFNSEWRASCYISHVRASDLKEFVMCHYLKKYPAIIVCSLGMYHGPFLCGMVMFAEAPRETSKRYGGKTWELARLWISDSIPRNGESWLIAQAIKHVKSEHKEIFMLVSYADPKQGHMGTIYRASNWRSDGRTDQERKTARFDYCDKTTGHVFGRAAHVKDKTNTTRVYRSSKYRYIYFLHKNKLESELDELDLFCGENTHA